MEFYHLLNRGVDKRDIVLDDSDRLRFIHSLFVFNNENYVSPNHRLKGYKQSSKERKKLVRIHAFCLMPNHYHLLVSPMHDDEKNLSKFMQKFNMGYAKYFNERHERSGYLWQGIYKKIHITKDQHFMYIPYYIHLNPLDLCMPEWREGNIKNSSNALKRLREYRWSSHLDYIGVKNFPSVITQTELLDILGKRRNYEKEIAQIISNSELTTNSESIEK